MLWMLTLTGSCNSRSKQLQLGSVLLGNKHSMDLNPLSLLIPCKQILRKPPNCGKSPNFLIATPPTFVSKFQKFLWLACCCHCCWWLLAWTTLVNRSRLNIFFVVAIMAPTIPSAHIPPPPPQAFVGHFTTLSFPGFAFAVTGQPGGGALSKAILSFRF